MFFPIFDVLKPGEFRYGFQVSQANISVLCKFVAQYNYGPNVFFKVVPWEIDRPFNIVFMKRPNDIDN